MNRDASKLLESDFESLEPEAPSDRIHQSRRAVVAVPCSPSDRQRFLRVLLGRVGRTENPA